MSSIEPTLAGKVTIGDKDYILMPIPSGQELFDEIISVEIDDEEKEKIINRINTLSYLLVEAKKDLELYEEKNKSFINI